MSEGRVVFYGFAVIYLVGVVVQFFLAGLALFGSTNYDAHRGLGYVLGAIAVVLLVIAVAAKLPRSLTGLSITLVVLNVIQIVLLAVRHPRDRGAARRQCARDRLRRQHARAALEAVSRLEDGDLEGLERT